MAGLLRVQDSESTSRVHLVPMLRDGVVAGLAGGLAVAVAHLVADTFAGEPLRTPTILGQLALGGLVDGSVRPDLETAFWFTGIHFASWLGLGMVGSWGISLVDAHPRLSALVFGGFAFVWISILYASGAMSIPGLPSLHLWLGTFLGSAAAAGYLVRRHPRLRGHVGREHLTPTTIREIVRTLAREQASADACERASREHAIAALGPVVAAKQSRLQTLRDLVDRYDLTDDDAGGGEPPWPRDEASPNAILRAALESERQTLALYDRFLYSMSDLEIRETFVRLRYHVADETIPLLEEAAPATD